MPKFQIGLPATLGTLLGLCILIALGSWQTSRYLDKQEIETARADLGVTKSVDLTRASQTQDRALDYRRVHLHGQLLTQHQALIKHRVHQGKPGHWLITPFQLQDGGVILVQRGWIPFQNPEQTTAALPTPPKKSLTGILYHPRQLIADPKGRAQPPRTLSDGQALSIFNSIDLHGFAQRIDDLTLPDSPPLVVLEAQESLDPYPIASTDQLTEPFLTSERHFGYAATWFSLAAALLLMYLAAAFGYLKSPSPSEHKPIQKL